MPPKRKQPGRTASDEDAKKKAKTDSPPFNFEWDSTDEGEMFCMHDPAGDAGRSKVVGFDIDWTIIQTKSGRKFATGPKDWTWWHEKVPGKLKELDDAGYRVIFFSNQGGIEKNKTTVAECKQKFTDIVNAAGIPIYVYFCTGENQYRKPSTEMWDHFAEHGNGKATLNLKQCKYVGDAAGRAKEWAPGKPRDFSCTDRMFAANVGIDFETPEEFFLAEKTAPFEWKSIDPLEHMPNKADADADESGGNENKQKYTKPKPELVILMGVPASGKSTFYRKYFKSAGYVHVNRDTLKTPAKCIAAADEALKSGTSVVVDNTNPSKAARSDYTALAKKHKVPCRCIHLDTSLEMARHLNYVRQNMTRGRVRRIPDVGFNVYKKNFEQPDKSEGFAEILTVSFRPAFDDERHRKLFSQWTA